MCLRHCRPDWQPRHYAFYLRPFMRPFVCYRTCQHDISNKNKPILMQIGTSGPRGNSMKRSEGQRSRSHSAELGHQNSFRRDVSRTIRLILTKPVHCVVTTRKQKVKGQGHCHTRPKIDLEAWRRHHSQPIWAE